MISYVKSGAETLGIIIPASLLVDEDSIKFVTPEDSTLQLGVMNRKAGHTIEPHVHRLVKREIFGTQEVLLIRSGHCLITFFSNSREMVGSAEVKSGDIIMFVSGGHSIKILADSVIIEVKQGPYLGELDKDRFDV